MSHTKSLSLQNRPARAANNAAEAAGGLDWQYGPMCSVICKYTKLPTQYYHCYYYYYYYYYHHQICRDSSPYPFKYCRMHIGIT